MTKENRNGLKEVNRLGCKLSKKLSNLTNTIENLKIVISSSSCPHQCFGGYFVTLVCCQADVHHDDTWCCDKMLYRWVRCPVCHGSVTDGY